MSADAEGIKGTQDFPRGDHTQTVCAYFRRWLRRSLLLPYKPLQNARYYYPIRDEADLIAYVWARDLGCDTHEDTSGIRTHIRPGHIKGHIFLTDLGRTTINRIPSLASENARDTRLRARPALPAFWGRELT